MASPTTKIKKKPTKDVFFAGRLAWHKAWQQCLLDFLQSREDFSGSKGTRAVYRNLLKQFFSDSEKNPNAYTQSDVRAFINRPTRKGPPRPQTRNARLEAVRTFYNFAAQYYLRYRSSEQCILKSRNPAYGIEFSRVPVIRRGWTKEELQRLFAVIPRDTEIGMRDYALCVTYFWTARRLSEVARWTRGDITVSGAFVSYQWSGKGRAGGVESAELPWPAWQAIQDYWRFCGRESGPPDEPVFLTGFGVHRKQLTADGIRGRIKIYAQAAGLPGSTHWFRHSRALACLLAGCNVVEIMRLLGHANLNTTQGYLEALSTKEDPTAKRLYEAYRF